MCAPRMWHPGLRSLKTRCAMWLFPSRWPGAAWGIEGVGDLLEGSGCSDLAPEEQLSPLNL